jgi:NTE family protein
MLEEFKVMSWKRKSIGLALGGGGARGLAHIGVIKVFQEESIPIDMVVGTSIGALVGAAYASGMGAEEMEKRTDEFLKSAVFQESALRTIKDAQENKRSTLAQKIQGLFMGKIYLAKALFRAGILQSEDFQAMIDYFVPDIQIEDTQIPFSSVVTDLVSGESVIISKGSLRKAVMASCAVPGAVAPLEDEKMLLSDGGIVDLVPTTAVREAGADFVIGVSVTCDIYSGEEFCSAIDIFIRASQILSFHLERSRLEKADVVIRPRVGNLHWTDFSLAGDLIQEGEKAARGKLDAIRKVLPSSIINWAYFSNLLRSFRMAA